MPRSTHAELRHQDDALLALLATHADGLARDALDRAYQQQYGQEIAERTLLRRLSGLQQAARIEAVGQGRATRYRVAKRSTIPATVDPSNATPVHDELYVPLSPEGAALRTLIQRPLMYREPIGYDLTWLEAYRPGVDWLLPLAMRERLHDSGRTPDAARPAGTYARDIIGRLLVDLAWASSRLEGNTCDRLDTQNLIEFGQRAEGKDAEETQMILNHKRAIEYLVDDVDRVGFSASSIRALHAALSENLLGDPADEGRLRRRPVQITGTPYLPTAIPQVIEDAFHLLLKKADAIPDLLAGSIPHEEQHQKGMEDPNETWGTASAMATACQQRKAAHQTAGAVRAFPATIKSC